jgi:hypothetical protein
MADGYQLDETGAGHPSLGVPMDCSFQLTSAQKIGFIFGTLFPLFGFSRIKDNYLRRYEFWLRQRSSLQNSR